jgi:hypothetical protein
MITVCLIIWYDEDEGNKPNKTQEEALQLCTVIL